MKKGIRIGKRVKEREEACDEYLREEGQCDGDSNDKKGASKKRKLKSVILAESKMKVIIVQERPLTRRIIVKRKREKMHVLRIRVKMQLSLLLIMKTTDVVDGIITNDDKTLIPLIKPSNAPIVIASDTEEEEEEDNKEKLKYLFKQKAIDDIIVIDSD